MLGEGHRKLSWIWEGAGADSDADISTGMHEGKSCIGLLFLMLLITNLALHVQWVKSRVRARSWTKEVWLLKEEMRRVIVTLEWKAAWWADRKEADDREVSVELREGLQAYAVDQALLHRSLARKFDAQWEPLLQHNEGRGLPPIVIAKMEALALAEKKAAEKKAEECREAEESDDAPSDSEDGNDASSSEGEEECDSDVELADD